MRCRIARPDTLRFARSACSSSGYRRPCWLGPTVMLSDARRITHHPFAWFASVKRVLACASASPPRIAASPNQSATSRATQFKTSSCDDHLADRHDRAGPRGERRRTCVAWTCAAFSDPAASLEVLSPTAHSGRAALFEAAGLERSRFDVSAPSARAERTWSGARPSLRFYAPRKQSGDARMMDVRLEFRSRLSSTAPLQVAMN